MIGIVIGIVIGFALMVVSVMPGAKFYEGRLATKQVLPPIEPAWTARLFLFAVGLATLLGGLWEIHRR